MHTRPLLIAAALAALSLSACNSEPETVNAGPVDPQASEVAAAPPVELPPSVISSKTYRCKDNSLVYVDFFNNHTAQFRTEKGGTPTTLTAPAEGQAYVADGYSVGANAAETEITSPGKPGQSCKA